MNLKFETLSMRTLQFSPSQNCKLSVFAYSLNAASASQCYGNDSISEAPNRALLFLTFITLMAA